MTARGGDFLIIFSSPNGRSFGFFFQELKEHCGAEVTHHLQEAEGLLADRNDWGVVGIYPTGGSMDDAPDGLLRMQPGYVGNRVGYLLRSASGNLMAGKAKATARTRARREAKGRDNGAQPKRAAAPNAGDP